MASIATKAPWRSDRERPRKPTAINPGGASARRTTANGASANAPASHGGGFPAGGSAPSRRRSCGRYALASRNVAGFEGYDERFMPDRATEEDGDGFVAEGWGELFPAGEEFGGDIFVVESEVAEKIADSLRAKLAGSDRKELKASSTENAEAYDAYLRGIAIWGKLSTSAESSETTATYYKRAVQLDPKFAVAWAAIERRSSWRKQRPRSPAPLNCNLIWATPGLRSAPIVIAA